MRLIAMIEDKTFMLERPTPAYLDAYTPRNRAADTPSCVGTPTWWAA